MKTGTLFSICAAIFVALACSKSGTAQEAPTIKVGIVYSFTGTGAPTDKQFDAAVDAWVKQHGDSVAGRKIVLIRRDDGGANPDVAKRLAQELIVQDNVEFLGGLLFTPNAIAAAQVSTAAKVPVLITEASTAGIMADNPYATRYSFTNGQLTKPLVDWALKHNVKTASIVYQNFGPGVDAADTFERYFVAGGGKLLERVAVPFTARDFSAYVQRIRDTKPDALYVFMVGDSGPAFIRAAYQGGIQQSGITILANGDMVSDERLPGIGDDALGVISSNMYYQNYPSRLNTAFVKLFRAAWGANSEPPGQAAVAAYDMMHAIYNAVQAQPGTLSLDRTMAVLRSTKFESPRGPIAIDPQTRDIVQNVYILRIERHGGEIGNREIGMYPSVRDPDEH
ncbi:MAG: ABC transporter substrate-binding protein [Candidatus Lustribacter sp.]